MAVKRFQEIFLESLKGPLADLLDLRSEAVFSFLMDQSPVQDSFRYRAKHLGLRVASFLIDEKGELHRERLEQLRRLLDQTPFIVGPNREGDIWIYNHLRNSLRRLEEDREIWTAIRRFSPPLCHKKAEEVIRETLWPESIRTVQTAHVRQAVLAAWLTLLRQTTGSCFATAPAILVQKNFPLQFFKDLYDLLSTGQLKRTIAGKEYSVPLSLSAGVGDLQRPSPFLAAAPGVRIALEAAGLTLTSAMQQKMKSPQTPEKLFRSLLLEDLGLTEEDVRDEELLSHMQMTPLLARQGAVYYQKPSARAQKVSEWKKKLTQACAVFKAVTECALLRSWEYTLASFCDVKTDFARWNLYIGLGLHPDQKEGIGAFLYEQIDGYLQQCNREIEQLSREYEQEMGAIQALETMIPQSVGEVRRNQLKAELMTHSLSLNSLFELRNQVAAKAEGLAYFFHSLLEQYDRKLQEDFQELFDPALLGEEAHWYDDSPAGFRLVYKHGRADASQWTAIYNGKQYIDCLRDFFSHVEGDLEAPRSVGRTLVSEITTALIRFIQEPVFLASATRRSREMGRRLPWDYISGGTLQTLLMAYCNRDRPFTESSTTVHSAEELLGFVTQIRGERAMLMHSPTHAFVFDPELLSGFTELDQTAPQQWDEPMREHLAHQIAARLPEEERALFLHLLRQKLEPEANGPFRTYLIEALGPRIPYKEALVDSVLYEQTPLFSSAQAKEAVASILLALGKNLEMTEEWEKSFYGPLDLYQMVKATFLKEPLSSLDWDDKIAKAMRQLGLSRHSVLFADTNWSTWLFGFVVNPATNRLELWRLNRNGTQGVPMSSWEEWLSPKNAFPWIVLSQPREYALE